MKDNIEKKCLEKGVKLTEQRKIIAKIMSESKRLYGESDHPDVDELYSRVSKIDAKISIATVYRTVKVFEEAGILTKHDFKGGKARYEQMRESHHDHLIDVKTGEIIDLGVKEGIIEKSGAWFSYGDERIGQGRENAKTFLKENETMCNEIEEKIRKSYSINDDDIEDKVTDHAE